MSHEDGVLGAAIEIEDQISANAARAAWAEVLGTQMHTARKRAARRERVDAYRRSLAEAFGVEDPSAIGPVGKSLATLAADPPEAPYQIVPGMFVEGSMNMLAGYSGAGKSLLAYWLGLFAAAGEFAPGFGPFEGSYAPVGVLYVDAEMPEAAQYQRASAMLSTLGEMLPSAVEDAAARFFRVTPEELLLVGDNAPHLNPVNAGQVLAVAALSVGADLIFVDSIAAICPGIEENDSKAWGWVKPLKDELERAGVTSIFLHHAGKGVATPGGAPSGGPRGSSALVQHMDTVLAIQNSGKCGFKIQPLQGTTGKDRYFVASHLSERTFKRSQKDEPFLIAPVDEPEAPPSGKKEKFTTYELEEFAREPIGKSALYQAVAEARGISTKTVAKHVDEAIASGDLIETKNGRTTLLVWGVHGATA